MRKIIMALLMLFCGILCQPSVQQQDTACLADAFEGSRFNIEESRISGWVRLDKPCTDVEGLKLLGREIYLSLGVVDGEYEEMMDKYGKKYIIKEESEEGIISVSVETLFNDSSQTYETAAVVDMTQLKHIDNIDIMGITVRECLERYGLTPMVSIGVRCFVPGDIEKKGMEEEIGCMLSKLSAIRVEGINSQNLVSVSAYVGSIPHYIETVNGRINVNIACRYSTSDDKTYLWAGTPVINMEY